MTFDIWLVLVEFIGVLAAALVLGALAERLKQSAVIGYLAAGVLLGPLLFQKQAIMGFADLGVALLLFSIGLEFSFRRLRSLGRVALVGGSLQIGLTMLVFAAGLALVWPWSRGVALGAIVALSSTAVVLRVLNDRSEIDAVHGRNALGILLLQDISVVPLVLLITLLASGGGVGDSLLAIAKKAAAMAALALLFYGLFNILVPRLVARESFRRNRELFHLLTIVAATGASWLAHVMGVSPALGAFLAGVMLAESGYGVQIRADIGPVRTLFVTLFFVSIGMMADPRVMLFKLPLLLLGLLIVFVGKAAVVYLVIRLLRQTRRHALATGFALAQIGEFSFVLAMIAARDGLIDQETLSLVSSVTVLSLFVSPLLVTYAMPLAEAVIRRWRKGEEKVAASAVAEANAVSPVVIVGFGPAGYRAALAYVEEGICPTIIEMNPQLVAEARDQGLTVQPGDATRVEVLEHAGVPQAQVVLITLPDPRTVRRIVERIRLLAPQAKLVVRARYNRSLDELKDAGAFALVDEESEVGRRLAAKAQEMVAVDADGARCDLPADN